MKDAPAPIALFVYKRLEHTMQTVYSLLENSLSQNSDLYIYSDAAKDEESESKVKEVRAWIEKISGFNKVTIIKRDINYGLARSIISGVTELVQKFDKVIVVEDDLVVSQYFLDFMNAGLRLYENSDEVASICGYAFPIKKPMPETYFLKGADCWGWATWKRAWNKFEANGVKLLAQIENKSLMHKFNFDGTQPNAQMLKDQILGKNDSWAIRWHASALINNMLTLYPGKSLVHNAGNDNSGEHCISTSIFDVAIFHELIQIDRIPIQENITAYESYVLFFKSIKPSIFNRILNRIKLIVLKIFTKGS
jgi:hypothetical protein